MRVLARNLRETAKWTRFPQNLHKVTPLQQEVKLSDLFKITRGIATGANKFFILTPERVAELKLPKKFLIPILPSARC